MSTTNMTYRIDMYNEFYNSGDYIGIQRDVATTAWNGQTFTARSRNGASMALARQLVEAGAPDRPWQAYFRPREHSPPETQRRSVYGPSPHKLAKLTITESDRVGPLLKEWKPYPERT